jgi:hypothetical protein
MFAYPHYWGGGGGSQKKKRGLMLTQKHITKAIETVTNMQIMIKKFKEFAKG